MMHTRGKNQWAQISVSLEQKQKQLENYPEETYYPKKPHSKCLCNLCPRSVNQKKTVLILQDCEIQVLRPHFF